MNLALERIESKLSKGIFPNVCQNPIEGGIYLAVHKRADKENPNKFVFETYRVRVETIKQTEMKALCFYIDDGSQEWLSYDPSEPLLYQLDRELFEIPAQVIHFSLFNLEDFADNTVAEDVVKKELRDKDFVAKIKTTKAQFDEQLESVDSDARINVILYDTSTSVDILVNKVLIERICERMQPPQLEPRKSSIVNVTQIGETGDIFCRMHGSKDMHAIKQIIHRLTGNGINEVYRVQKSDLIGAKVNVLYLVHDRSSGRWYRAQILPSMSQQTQKAMCKFIDYGHIKHIEHEDIYDLKRLSFALSKYPHQAITARLNGLDCEYTPKLITRLRDLLVGHKPISLEVVTRAEMAFVNVWKTVDGLHCNINEAIRREMNVER